MPVTHESSDLAQLRHLLRRLEATQNGAAAPPHVDGWLDWIRGSGFGTAWFTELAQQCRTLASLSVNMEFKYSTDDFRANLAAFRDLVFKASNDKHARTEPLETQVLRLWTPLEPQLTAYQSRLNAVRKTKPRDLSLLESDLARVDAVLAAMAPYVAHYKPELNKR